MLHKDVTLHEPQVSALQEKAGQLHDDATQRDVDDLVTKYRNLLSGAEQQVSQLELQVAAHEQYKATYHDAMEWVMGTRQRLQGLNDSAGSAEAIQQRLTEVEVGVGG